MGNRGGSMFRFMVMALLIAGLLIAGCSKKNEDVEALEKEAAQDDAAAVMDSLNQVGTETTPEVTETTKPTTEPVKKPEKPAVETDNLAGIEGYVVQIGSYASHDFAAMMAEKYQKREFPAFIRSVDIDGNTYYRLRIGVYETVEEAKMVGDIIKDRYSVDYWVDNNR